MLKKNCICLAYCLSLAKMQTAEAVRGGGIPIAIVQFYSGTKFISCFLSFSTACGEKGKGNVEPPYQAFH